MTIDASKFESIDGIVSSVSMNEPVPIGLFMTHPSRASREQIIFLEPMKVTDGTQTLTFRVDTLPRYVSIDPYGTRPDLVRQDNWLQLN